MLIWIDQPDIPTTSADIGKIICAEIPDKESHPKDFMKSSYQTLFMNRVEKILMFIIYKHSANRIRFCLRFFLVSVKEAQSFQSLKTHNGVEHPTFQ